MCGFSTQQMFTAQHTNAVYHQSFEAMQTAVFSSTVNAHCWQRQLTGDFSAITQAFESKEDLLEISVEDLMALHLHHEGQDARDVLIADLLRLERIGAQPSLNLIRRYARDTADVIFPVDVYSFHVDRAPEPIATYLCTYIGAASELLPNHFAEQKINIPHMRQALEAEYTGKAEDFDAYLREHFYDLHYSAKSDATLIPCGNGNLWRLAVDCPGSGILPCIHRAPVEEEGQARLLLIC